MEYIDYSKYFSQYYPSFKEKLDNTKIDYNSGYSNPLGLSEFIEIPQFPSFETYLKDTRLKSFYDLFDKSGVVDSLSTTSDTIQNSQLETAIQNHLGETYSNSRRLSPGYSDCSGFVNKVYKDMGVDLKGATSIKMYTSMTDHISYDQVKPGDLVFLTSKQTRNVAGTKRRAGVDPSHVAIVVLKEGTKIKVAEASGHTGKTHYIWYELGGADKPSGNGTINYSKGNKSKVKNELLGFGRLRV